MRISLGPPLKLRVIGRLGNVRRHHVSVLAVFIGAFAGPAMANTGLPGSPAHLIKCTWETQGAMSELSELEMTRFSTSKPEEGQVSYDVVQFFDALAYADPKNDNAAVVHYLATKKYTTDTTPSVHTITVFKDGSSVSRSVVGTDGLLWIGVETGFCEANEQ